MMTRRWPIRRRLTAAFGVALVVVLTGVGVFLYLRVSVALDRALEAGLLARTAEVGALVVGGELPQPGTARGLESDESLIQVLRSDGSIITSTPALDFPLLTPAEAGQIGDRDTFLDRAGDQRLDENLRLLATPVTAPSGPLIIIVAASLDEKTEALAALQAVEITGLAGALVISCMVGYLVAGLALRPVEALRQQAAELTADRLVASTGPPLPVPPADDEISRLAVTLNVMLSGLRAAQRAERDALERQRRFVAEASHQLRTPLTIIKSEVELAAMDPTVTGTPTAALSSIAEEADRLVRLTDQLLTLAAGDAEQLSLRLRPVQVLEVLERAAERHRGRAAELDRTLEVSVRAELSVPADELWLGSALDNLVDNALRHGRGGIVLIGTTAEEGVRLIVRDAGDGWPAASGTEASGTEASGTELFERFRKGPGSSGSGLGLAIVQTVIRAHGGTVRAGPGAEVSLTLPAGDAVATVE